MGWLSQAQLEGMGLRALGENVRVSDRCALHGVEAISLGSHVRIDDFAVITAREPVTIGSHVHISAQVFIGGTHGVEIADFVNLSIGAAIFSATDDFSGHHLIGPTVPDKYRGLTSGKVTFGKHTGVGAHSVVLPGVTFPDGAAAGALTLVNRSPEPWTLYSGVPMRRVKATVQRLVEMEAQLRAEEAAGAVEVRPGDFHESTLYPRLAQLEQLGQRPQAVHA
jgi:galactoside O-acetyltransferase